jgi:cardiolipin synthase
MADLACIPTAAFPAHGIPLPPLALSAWQSAGVAATLCVAAATMFHVLLKKRDPRSAAYWMVIVAFVPLLGSLFYLLFGVNYIRRQGRHLMAAHGKKRPLIATGGECLEPVLCSTMEPSGRMLARTLHAISRFAFTRGNAVTILRNGDEALPRMLEAIDGARASVTFASYIFEATGIGADFVNALERAHHRGVPVRVMVDDAGTRYGWPPVTRELRARGVPVSRFMPNRLVTRLATMNLRNHRKTLVVDGVTGFTGGMNIREGNMLSRSPSHPVQDLHFEVRGPVVAQIQQVFAEDWEFCSGEHLEGESFFPHLPAADPPDDVTAIGLPDGPDGDVEVMPAALLAALNSATRSIKIATPYFLPPPVLAAALRLAVTRGVEVSIVTPAVNNIPFVGWAARTLYPGLIDSGCSIFESPPPFDHSKIFLIDSAWSFIGSTNWDPRSLRLNFEFNLACHDIGVAEKLDAIFEEKKAAGNLVTLAALEDLPLGAKLRNGAARLFIPLL